MSPSNNPLVSIVICTYNRQNFLKDCLESLTRLKSSPDLYEIIIIDNNSTDQTNQIAQQFIQEHPYLNIKVEKELKQGLSNARNRGILESKGTYIAFIDDDALIDPFYVENLSKFVREFPQIQGFGGKIVPVFTDGQKPKWSNRFSQSLFFSAVNYGDGIKILHRKNQYPFGCNMVIKKTYFDRHDPFDSAIGPISKDGGRCDDKILFLEMRKHGYPIYYVPGLVVHHQIDTHRLTPDYIKKLSLGLGYSLRLLAQKEGKWSILKRGWGVTYKLAGTLILALLYLLRGKAAVAKHLIQYRWWVFKGYWFQ